MVASSDSKSCHQKLVEYSRKLTRSKTVDTSFFETSLRRCLTTFDITFIGVGHMIGAGIYVLTGAEAKRSSGPSILISYFMAGVASILSALCYAEFGARVPKAGSAYTYTYVTIGEVWAFIIGWDMVLEYTVGAAAVASSLSGYIWSLAKTPSNSNTTCIAKNASEAFLRNLTNGSDSGSPSGLGSDDSGYVKHILNEELDWVAVILVLAICVFMSIGVRISTNGNTLFVCINLTVITIIVIYGMTVADFQHNWIDVKGGFMPFGFGGVLQAAATCFFAYAGFDGIATAGEEAANPSRSIPLATFFAMFIVTVCYCLMSVVLTGMVPYYRIDSKAAFTEAFGQTCHLWAKYVVSVGALAGMCTTLFGQMFSLPRTVYAIADDGLIFKFLAYVHPKTKVPFVAIFLFGFAVALVALFISTDVLVDLLAIGTLNAYALDQNATAVEDKAGQGNATVISEMPAVEIPENGTMNNDQKPGKTSSDFAEHSDNGGQLKKFDIFRNTIGRPAPGVVVQFSMVALTCCAIATGCIIHYGNLLAAKWFVYLLLALAIFGMLFFLILICMFDENEVPLRFKVRWVPFLPVASVVVNVVLVCNLDPVTWARFIAWLAMGMVIYLSYGVNHSSENPNASERAKCHCMDPYRSRKAQYQVQPISSKTT